MNKRMAPILGAILLFYGSCNTTVYSLFSPSMGDLPDHLAHHFNYFINRVARLSGKTVNFGFNKGLS